MQSSSDIQPSGRIKMKEENKNSKMEWRTRKMLPSNMGEILPIKFQYRSCSAASNPKILKKLVFSTTHIARIYTKVPINPDKCQGDNHVSIAIWLSACQLFSSVIGDRGYRGVHVEHRRPQVLFTFNHHGMSHRVCNESILYAPR